MAPPEITAREASARLAGADAPRLVDVREEEEWQRCHVEGAVLLPLSRFAEQAPAVLSDLTEPLLILCHHGVRSAHAAAYLLSHGYTDVTNVAGGIDAWAVEVDSALPRY